MRLLADECCHGEFVRLLRQAGHDVMFIAEELPSIDDTDVLSLAHAEGRILITDDKDFGELAIRRLQPASGVVLLRTNSIDPRFEARRILDLIDLHGPDLTDMFCVVEDDRFRIRSLK
jgi:predicted nuclease of predicted toxin-antitoxin system